MFCKIGMALPIWAGKGRSFGRETRMVCAEFLPRPSKKLSLCNEARIVASSPAPARCYVKREGAAHSLWCNPNTSKVEAVPRHTEISDLLARKTKDLSRAFRARNRAVDGRHLLAALAGRVEQDHSRRGRCRERRQSATGAGNRAREAGQAERRRHKAVSGSALNGPSPPWF